MKTKKPLKRILPNTIVITFQIVVLNLFETLFDTICKRIFKAVYNRGVE